MLSGKAIGSVVKFHSTQHTPARDADYAGSSNIHNNDNKIIIMEEEKISKKNSCCDCTNIYNVVQDGTFGHFTPMSSSRSLRKSCPCSGLVKKSANMLSVGQYSSLISPWSARSLA